MDPMDLTQAALTSLCAAFSIASGDNVAYRMWLNRYEGKEGKRAYFFIEGDCVEYRFDVEPNLDMVSYLEEALKCLKVCWEKDRDRYNNT